MATRHLIDRRVHQVAADPIGMTPDRLLTTKECADWLGVSPTWLAIGRGRKYGPTFVRLTSKLVRYKVSDVLEWLAERKHRSTKEYATAGGRPPKNKAAA